MNSTKFALNNGLNVVANVLYVDKIFIDLISIIINTFI